jgi:phenylacetate-CoA ligase
MSLLQDGHLIPLDDIAQHRQHAWERQSAYVAENSAFYQRLWGGQAPPKRLEDIAELPFSDKAGLRLSQPASPPFGDYLAAAPDKVRRLHRTSGTTGQAMNLAMSASDCEITEIVGGRAQSLAGLKAGTMVVHCLNYQMWMGGLTDHLTLERTGATVVPFGVGSTELLINTILETGITAISCTPSYPAVLERVIAEAFPGLRPRDLGLKLGLFGGEPGIDDPAFRKRLSETWGMQPRNANYGVSDVFCNFASECAHDTALHFVAHDVLHVELIDPDSGAPRAVAAGNEGELVLTHLSRECQPLVRFRTGDIIRIETTEVCACGCAGFRFRVIGRSDDMVVVRGLNMFPTMVAAVVTSFDELSGDYRIVLDAPPPHDVLPVHVELAADGQDDGTLTRRLEDRCKQKLGATIRVKIVPHGTFPRTEGKTKRVIRSYE